MIIATRMGMQTETILKIDREAEGTCLTDAESFETDMSDLATIGQIREDNQHWLITEEGKAALKRKLGKGTHYECIHGLWHTERPKKVVAVMIDGERR